MFRLPGTMNIPDAKKIEKRRVARRSGVIGGSGKPYHLTEFKKAVPKADAPASGNAVATSNMKESVKIDWRNVPADFAPDQEELDAHNVPPYAQHALMMGDDDTLDDLNKKLAAAGYGDTYYPSYSHLQLGLANALKRSLYSTEKSAGFLSNTKLKCNKHIKDMNPGAQKRSVTRALTNAGFEEHTPPNVRSGRTVSTRATSPNKPTATPAPRLLIRTNWRLCAAMTTSRTGRTLPVTLWTNWLATSQTAS